MKIATVHCPRSALSPRLRLHCVVFSGSSPRFLWALRYVIFSKCSFSPALVCRLLSRALFHCRLILSRRLLHKSHFSRGGREVYETPSHNLSAVCMSKQRIHRPLHWPHAPQAERKICDWAETLWRLLLLTICTDFSLRLGIGLKSFTCL